MGFDPSIFHEPPVVSHAVLLNSSADHYFPDPQLSGPFRQACGLLNIQKGVLAHIYDALNESKNHYPSAGSSIHKVEDFLKPYKANVDHLLDSANHNAKKMDFTFGVNHPYIPEEFSTSAHVYPVAEASSGILLALSNFL